MAQAFLSKYYIKFKTWQTLEYFLSENRMFQYSGKPSAKYVFIKNQQRDRQHDPTRLKRAKDAKRENKRGGTNVYPAGD